MRIEYRDWDNLQDKQILYAYRCDVEHTTFAEKAVIGEITENTVIAKTQRTYTQAFRKKKDGTFYKKDTCRWGNRFFTSQAEAEADRDLQIGKLRERLNDQITICQKRLQSL